MISTTLRAKGYRYLTHVFLKKNLASLLASGQIYSEYDRYRHRLQIDGAYSTTTFRFDRPWTVDPGQYPGVYMGLYDALPVLAESEMAFVFPLEILDNQVNWHFNLFDRNGTMGYDTYTSETITDVPPFDEVKAFYLQTVGRYFNEIVFHDTIDLRNATHLYDGEECTLLVDHGVPHQLCPDPRRGAFVYYSDIYYSGMKVPYFSRPEEHRIRSAFYREWCLRHIRDSDRQLIPSEDTALSCRDLERILESKEVFTKMYLER